ncbi:NAD(P)/FAD-dependent oxidoreductase [Woeseiaceae bacterium]|nr:NAD(P)/FAD-dependent oxidoreductase [Woeseiaceae bacterium]
MIKTDVVIIGAGPCGLFQVFELGLLGLNAEVIDSIRQPGGQCTELYADKPIYDIPGIPVCSAEELTLALLKQIEPFNYGMHLGEEVTIVRKNDDASFHVETSAGKKFQAKAVVIAGGVGSFQPRQLKVPGADKFSGKTLHYRVRDSQQFADKKLAIFGGGDSAMDWVLELVDVAEHITLVHRSDQYRAAPASVDKMRRWVADGKMDVIENAQVIALYGENSVIKSIKIQPREGEPIDISVDHILAFFGLVPKLGPIAEWGLDINRKTINVDTEKFETSEPGIYAIGDISFYPGKKKLILCGFHEAVLAAFAIKKSIEPNKKTHLQYTTTSPILHKRLGISLPPQ